MKKVDHFHQLMTLTEISELKNFQQIFQNTQPLSETGIAPLNVVNKSKSQIFCSNLKKFHIIEEKRICRLNPKYAIQHVFISDQHTFIFEKISKIFAFHATFLVEINRISEISIHAKDLPPPSTN